MIQNLGISSYGFALPSVAVDLSVLCELSGQSPESGRSLGIISRTVASNEENSFTLGLQAAHMCLMNAKSEKEDVHGLFFGSETPLYASNPTAPFLAEALGLGFDDFQAYDVEFACKSGTAACESALNRANRTQKPQLVVAADVGSGKLGDTLFLTAGSGAASLMMSPNKDEIIAEVVDHVSFVENREDFWKPQGQRTPNHAGRWSNEAYLKLITKTGKAILEKNNKKIEAIDHVVLHMPNGKLPARAAKMLGANKEQMQAGFSVGQHGNLYSACGLVGLCGVLDVATPNQTILFVNYGSGSGTDGFLIKTTSNIISHREKRAKNKTKSVQETLKKLRKLSPQAFVSLSQAF